MSTHVVTRHWPKPIPDRRFDWEAMFDDYEPGHPIGYGTTENAAVADLWNEVELRRDDYAGA